MRKKISFLLLTVLGGALGGLLQAEPSDPVALLVTQYIAPVSSPVWETRVETGEYGTGKGLDYEIDYTSASGYFNYRRKIAGIYVYASSTWVS
jgi:hypothetical protein